MADLSGSIIAFDFASYPVQISERVKRLTAPNPGPMTGPGTNTYLLGEREVAVIDPGPAIDSHIDAILEAAQGNLQWVIVTHTHPDHSPAANILHEKTGAVLLGANIADDGHQDTSFKPAVEMTDNYWLKTREFSLQAIATPGHVANHFCYYLAEEQALFTGDHIMEGVTSVIIPPSGDMADFIHSMERLKTFPLQRLLPAHGHVMNQAVQIIDAIIDHRLARERKVVDALREAGRASVEQLVAKVYADVDSSLWSIAKISLWAHLLKLEKDGRAVKQAEQHWLFGQEVWQLV